MINNDRKGGEQNGKTTLSLPQPLPLLPTPTSLFAYSCRRNLEVDLQTEPNEDEDHMESQVGNEAAEAPVEGEDYNPPKVRNGQTVIAYGCMGPLNSH